MRTVHLFVFDALSDWEPGFAIAGTNNPQFQRGPAECRVRTVSVGGKPVTTIGGLRIQPDGALEAVDPRDSAMLILPGGARWDDRKHTSNSREYLAQTKYAGARLYQDERVVRDGNLITASAMASLEFAREIFDCLQVYKPEVLDAWYKLFATGKPEYFAALMAAAAGKT